MLTAPVEQFVKAVEFGSGIAQRIRPVAVVKDVVIDPLRQFGEPVVRSVRTDVIAEQVRAGDSIQMIADLYELTAGEVESALRYELIRGMPDADLAA
jgi:uncharacterized protein (DUF433 family)